MTAIGIGKASHAQQYSVMVGGASTSCISAQNTPVKFIFSEAAKEYSGGYAHLSPSGVAVIYLDAATINSMPDAAAIFTALHECGHHALPFGVGLASQSQETNADFYAMQTMSEQKTYHKLGEV